MVLFTRYRSAVLSVSLAALCAAMPISSKLGPHGLSLGGSAAAQDLPGAPDDPGSPPDGGMPGGGPGPADLPDPGAGPSGPPDAPDPGPSGPGETAGSGSSGSGPEAGAPSGPSSPDVAEQGNEPSAAPAPSRPTEPGAVAAVDPARDRGGNRDEDASDAAVSTMSSPTDDPNSAPGTPREKATNFAKTLECQTSCTATISGNGNVELVIDSQTVTGEDVKTAVLLKNTTVTTNIAVDNTPTATATQTFATRKQAEEQVRTTSASVTAVLKLDVSIATYGAPAENFQASIAAAAGIDPARVRVLAINPG